MSPEQLEERRLTLSEHEKEIELLILVNCQLWESLACLYRDICEQSAPGN